MPAKSDFEAVINKGNADSPPSTTFIERFHGLEAMPDTQ